MDIFVGLASVSTSEEGSVQFHAIMGCKNGFVNGAEVAEDSDTVAP